ncbi:MAG: hypothetical protein HYZ22_01155 [Chloroflexi bacterium]|nr:hypothetical protein [Chloroflexota bacterium]
MKKNISFLLLVLLSLSCSLGSLAPAATSTPAPTQTDTATPLPTSTPVLPTLTFTLTPTLIGYKTSTPTQLPTETFTLTPIPVVLPTNTLLPPVKMEGFVSVVTSLTEIYKDKGCFPAVVRVTAQLNSTVNVAHVLLFARFKSLKAERTAKWTTIEMQPLGAGTFIHDLASSQMLDDAYFETSWIEYQIVSATKSGAEVGRTDIFKERLKMLECVPTHSPTSANVKP